MEITKVILVGGGQHAAVVLDSLFGQGVDVVAVFDTIQKGNLFGVPILGAYDPSLEVTASAIVALGDNKTRKTVAERVLHPFATTIHPSVIFAESASVGVGDMILHGAIVQARARIGNHVIINTGAQVDHDCVIGDYVHIAPRVVLCGSITVGEGTLIGAGATVIPGRKIGAWATIGAGTVVIEDVPDYAVVVGNPGRVIKYNKP